MEPRNLSLMVWNLDFRTDFGDHPTPQNHQNPSQFSKFQANFRTRFRHEEFGCPLRAPLFPIPLGVLYDGMSKKFENFNFFIKLWSYFVGESSWILSQISDLEAKIWKSASEVKNWKFLFFLKFLIISIENIATKMEMYKTHPWTLFFAFFIFLVDRIFYHQMQCFDQNAWSSAD